MMTPEMCEVSVLICAYTEDRWDDLIAAVTSVLHQTQQPDEVIVVIDHNPSLLERARKQFPSQTVIENTAMKGLSGARNTGLAVARGHYIAFLDDDAEAEADWLERLLNCCADPRVLGAGGTVVPYWQGVPPQWFPPEFYWVLGCTYQALPPHPVVVRNPFGGCCCIKREVFQSIGGFSEGIGRIGANGMGGEETELSIRAKQHWPDKVFVYEPNARIHHHIPAQRARWSYFLSRCYSEGRSKAAISKRVGSNDALSSERIYIAHLLLVALKRGTVGVLLGGGWSRVLCAGAIMGGFTTTVLGYLQGMFLEIDKHEKLHGV